MRPPLVRRNWKKGFFPRLYNTLDHQEYLGCFPDISSYDPEGMSLSKKKEFETWYASQVEEGWEVRDPVQKRIRTDTQTKKYGLVFDKQVLKPGTFKSYPYGYERVELNHQDMLNVDTLLLLQ